MKTILSSIQLSLVVLCSFTVAIAEEAPRNRVLVIGIDGIRRDALLQAETPNLKSLIKQGAFSENTEILGERYSKNNTISGPGWSSFLTGVWADKHGVHDNSFEGRNYDEFPHFFSRVKEQFPKARTGSFVDWEPIDKFIVRDADVRKVYPSQGADEYAQKDVEIAKDAVAFLEEDQPHVVMVYFGAVDETGHRYGFHPSVKQYMSAIETVDGHVGAVLKAMKSRTDYDQENWLVIVSTDHGGVGTGHGDGHDKPEIRNTFLIVSGANSMTGQIEEQTYLVDLPVTALTHLGVKIDPKWKLDGKAVGLNSIQNQ
ncbi:alkaline phosphatase family protein [Thalassoglobus sp.]|uniref:alkaline phosphatase family protein n=1 Tax=Thalassoglobus sp. TaxID=2795869 RepID=UPI003AA8F0E2